MKTYSRKDNATRAAIKQGLTVDAVQPCDGGFMIVGAATEAAEPARDGDDIDSYQRVAASVVASQNEPGEGEADPAAKKARKAGKKSTAKKPAKKGNATETPAVDAVAPAPRGRAKNPEAVAKYMALVSRDGGASFADIMAAIGDKPRKWLFGTAVEQGYALELVKTDRTAGHYVAHKNP